MISVLDEAMPQTAKCGVCGSQLEFDTGSYGQTVERCSNRRCVYHAPHSPRPDSLQPGRARMGEGPRRKDRKKGLR